MPNKSTLSYEVKRTNKKYFYPTPETKGNEFYDKMDSITKEIKDLIDQLQKKQKEGEELVKAFLKKDPPAQESYRDYIYEDGTWNIEGDEIPTPKGKGGTLIYEFFNDKQNRDIHDAKWEKSSETDWNITSQEYLETSYEVEVKESKFRPSLLEWEGIGKMKYGGEDFVEKDLGYSTEIENYLEWNSEFHSVSSIERWDETK